MAASSREKRGERRSNNKHHHGDASQDTIPSLPWTQQETEALTEVVEYLSRQLKKQQQRQERGFDNDHNSDGDDNGANKESKVGLVLDQTQYELPSEDASDLLHFLQEFLKQDGVIDRQDPLLAKIAYYFNQLQCVDLDKVTTVMKKNRAAEEKLDGQDVILLLGATSSGKTTTLHSLAGTTFKEVEVDGFVHLKPTKFLDASVAGFETSSSRTAVTKSLQTCPLYMHDQEYLVCDTPGFGSYETVEEEISNGLGVVRAISKARTIRPVFVLSQECLGSRLSGFPQIYQMMINLFDIDPSGETIPFQYVFTRFEEKYRIRLCKMFKYLKETVSNYDDDEKDRFLRIVDDIVHKTTPEANIVSPVTDIPRFLMRSLLDNKHLVCEPRDWLKPFVSDKALDALHKQLELTLHGLQMYLASADYDRAVQRMKQLQTLQEVIPEYAKEYSRMAHNACMRHAILLFESFNERIEKRDYGSAMARVSASMKLRELLPNATEETFMLTPDSFWERFMFSATHENYIMSKKSVKQLRRMTKSSQELQGEFKRGIRAIRNNIDNSLETGENVTKATALLTQLVMLAQAFPDAADFATELLEKFEKNLMRLINKKEFNKATEQLVAMQHLTREFPEQVHFARYGLKLYRNALESALEKKFYEHATELLLDLTRLEPFYESAEKYGNRGLEKMWKHFSEAIKHREYCTSVCIVKHMSKLAHKSPGAYEKTTLGIEVIRDRLFKSIENKNYNMAQVLMQQLTKLEKVLPDAPPKSLKASAADKHEAEEGQEEESSTGISAQSIAKGQPARRNIPSPLRRQKRSPSPPFYKHERGIPSPFPRGREEYTPTKTHKRYVSTTETPTRREDHRDEESCGQRAPNRKSRNGGMDDGHDRDKRDAESCTPPRTPRGTREPSTGDGKSRGFRTPGGKSRTMDDETVSQITMDTRDFRKAPLTSSTRALLDTTTTSRYYSDSSNTRRGRNGYSKRNTQYYENDDDRRDDAVYDKRRGRGVSKSRERAKRSSNDGDNRGRGDSRSRVAERRRPTSSKASRRSKSRAKSVRSKSRGETRSKSRSRAPPKSSFEEQAERELSKESWSVY